MGQNGFMGWLVFKHACTTHIQGILIRTRSQSKVQVQVLTTPWNNVNGPLIKKSIISVLIHIQKNVQRKEHSLFVKSIYMTKINSK